MLPLLRLLHVRSLSVVTQLTAFTPVRKEPEQIFHGMTRSREICQQDNWLLEFEFISLAISEDPAGLAYRSTNVVGSVTTLPTEERFVRCLLSA